MKRQIGIGTLVLASSLTGHAGSPVIAERGLEQLDSGESFVSANGITLAYVLRDWIAFVAHHEAPRAEQIREIAAALGGAADADRRC